jgi:hypothetical protein
LHFFGFLASVICCRPLDSLGKCILCFLMLSNMRMQLEHEHPNSRPPLKQRGGCSPFLSTIESYIYMKSRNMILYNIIYSYVGSSHDLSHDWGI